MKISPVNYNYINFKNINKSAGIKKVVAEPVQTADVFVKQNKGKAKKIVPAVIISVMALLGATCSRTRGGDFVYSEVSHKIVKHYDTQKPEKKSNAIYSCNKYNLKNCYDKDFFKTIDVDKWIEEHKEKLVGSCLFDTNDIFMSRVIAFFTNQSHCKYVPTHAASIYKDENNQMKIMQIKPPKVVVEDLADYIKNTKNDYMIYLRDFDIDTDKFSENVKKDEGRKYGYLSAAQTLTNLIDFDFGLHCSESYVQQLQKFGFFKGINANDITPHTLLHLLTNMGSKEKSTIS